MNSGDIEDLYRNIKQAYEDEVIELKDGEEIGCFKCYEEDDRRKVNIGQYKH